jgi:hypothetical protein
MKKACFCALTGSDVTLSNHDIKPDNEWDYYCITDQDITSNFWKIIKIDSDLDPKWLSRYIYTHFYEYLNHDIVVKIDASMVIKRDFNCLLDYLTPETDIVLAYHDRRICIYDEFNAVNKRFPEYKNIVDNQKERYLKEGFPIKYGLHSQGGRIIRNNEKIRHFYKLWWEELKISSWRDQLSFDYIRWKLANTENEIKISNIDFYKLYIEFFEIPRYRNNENRYSTQR